MPLKRCRGKKTNIAPYSPFLDGSWNLTGCCGRHERQKRSQSHGTLSYGVQEQPPGRAHFWCIVRPYLHPFALGLLLEYSCLLCVSLTPAMRVGLGGAGGKGGLAGATAQAGPFWLSTICQTRYVKHDLLTMMCQPRFAKHDMLSMTC